MSAAKFRMSCGNVGGCLLVCKCEGGKCSNNCRLNLSHQESSDMLLESITLLYLGQDNLDHLANSLHATASVQVLEIVDQVTHPSWPLEPSLTSMNGCFTFF